MSDPYTFVAYKPNSSDYCMGCYMESYSSEFAFETGLSEDELVVAWANCLMFVGGTNEDGWESIHIIDGAGDIVDFGPEYDRLKRRVEQEIARQKAELVKFAADQAEKQRQDAAETAERHAAAATKHERAEYERLCKKFGGKCG